MKIINKLNLISKKKKISFIILGLIIISLLGMVMYQMGLNRIKDGSMIVGLEKVDYRNNFKTSGIIESNDSTMMMIPGTVIAWRVEEGQKVDVNTELLIYQDMGEQYSLNSNRDGVILIKNNQYLIIGNPNSLKVVFELSKPQRQNISLNQEIMIENTSAKINFISEIASNDANEEVYRCYAILPKGLKYPIGSNVSIEIMDSDVISTLKINSNCLVQTASGNYVIYPSILNHLSTPSHNDYAKVNIVSYQDGYYLIDQIDASSVLQLSDFSKDYFKELLHSL